MDRLNWSVSHVMDVALLAVILGLVVYGIVYAATPSTFVVSTPYSNPIAIVAKTTDELLITEYCVPPGGWSIFSVDSEGNFTQWGDRSTRPNDTRSCLEEYLAISPGVPGFPADYVYVTQGKKIFEFTSEGKFVEVLTVTTIYNNDHTGITFDQVGTFESRKMIITSQAGHVYTIGSDREAAFLANVGEEHESPVVIPVGFGPLGGQVWTAAENSGRVIATSPTGEVTTVVTETPRADVIQLIPNSICNFGASGGAFFVTNTFNDGGLGRIVKFPASDFTGLEGDVLVAGEPVSPGSSPAYIYRISNPGGTGYEVSNFEDPPVARFHEGATFALCPTGVPNPAAVPEASTLLLLGSGLASLAGYAGLRLRARRQRDRK
jgi:hypothetical protein